MSASAGYAVVVNPRRLVVFVLVLGVTAVAGGFVWATRPGTAAPADDTGMSDREQRELLQEIGYLK